MDRVAPRDTERGRRGSAPQKAVGSAQGAPTQAAPAAPRSSGPATQAAPAAPAASPRQAQPAPAPGQTQQAQQAQAKQPVSAKAKANDDEWWTE